MKVFAAGLRNQQRGVDVAALVQRDPVQTGSLHAEVARYASLFDITEAPWTVVFTDIEGSTRLNAPFGDRAWLEVLRAHNAA